MVLALLHLKLKHIFYFLFVALLLSYFLFGVSDEAKQSLIAPNSPLYFVTQIIDSFKDYQTISAEKAVFLVDSITYDNPEVTSKLLQEYMIFTRQHLDSLAVENCADAMDNIINNTILFLNTLDDSFEYRSEIKDAIEFNLRKRQKILDCMDKEGSSIVQIEGYSIERILEATPSNKRDYVWKLVNSISSQRI